MLGGRSICVGALLLRLGFNDPSLAGADWTELDARVARVTRERTYQVISSLADFEAVRAVFERAFSADASVVPDLMALVAHEDELVAMTAAQLLGRFPGESASSLLQETLTADERLLVRAQALTGLVRMDDPAAPGLVLAALSSDDAGMQGAAIGGLEMLADSEYSQAMLEYLDRQADVGIDPEWLEILGSLGDPPGSTAVRDRLLSVASKKDEYFDMRVGAAEGLERMGLGSLSPAREILDLHRADSTSQGLGLVERAIKRLGVQEGVAIDGQAAVDALLQEAELGGHGVDAWNRAFRVRFVSKGVFQVISDGPDMAPDTDDDMSSDEPFGEYQNRVFRDLFS
jgi:hypothetical protein